MAHRKIRCVVWYIVVFNRTEIFINKSAVAGSAQNSYTFFFYRFVLMDGECKRYTFSGYEWIVCCCCWKWMKMNGSQLTESDSFHFCFVFGFCCCCFSRYALRWRCINAKATWTPINGTHTHTLTHVAPHTQAYRLQAGIHAGGIHAGGTHAGGTHSQINMPLIIISSSAIACVSINGMEPFRIFISQTHFTI